METNYELKFTYYVSKLAKQYNLFADPLYEAKNNAMKGLCDKNVLILKGFHKVGEYNKFNGFGVQTKSFYADYYETPDQKWGFHTLRANGRGKGLLGEIENLSENSAIKKLTKKDISTLNKDVRIKGIIKEINKFQKSEGKRIADKLNEMNGIYTDFVFSKFSDDTATFKYEQIAPNQIKLTGIIEPYLWANRYGMGKVVGQIITL